MGSELETLRYKWVQPFLHLLARHLQPGSRVLEAGCGPGRILHWLQQEGHWPVGLDFSAQALDSARRVCSAVAMGDVRSLPFRDGCLDACLSFGVVEHFLEGPDATLAEAYRVLVPGGVLIIGVPHSNVLARLDPSLKAAYRRLRGIPPPAPDSLEPPGRCYRRQELRAAVERNGFRIAEIMPFAPAYTLHSFCGLFRKRGAYHDVTPLAHRLGVLAERLAPWALASTVLIAGHKR